MALDEHAALPDFALVQLCPAVDGANLNTHHVLVAVIGRKVAHGLGLFDPRIPGNGILDIVADDIETWLAIFDD